MLRLPLLLLSICLLPLGLARAGPPAPTPLSQVAGDQVARAREFLLAKAEVSALENAVAALNTRYQTLGPSHPATAEAWLLAAEAYEGKAGLSWRQALWDIALSRVNEDHPLRGEAEAGYVFFLKNSHRREEALQFGAAALARAESQSDPDNLNLAWLHNALGHGKRSQKPEAAREHFKEAIRILELHDLQERLAVVLTWYAYGLFRMGLIEESKDAATRAVNAAEAAFEEGHIRRREALGTLCLLSQADTVMVAKFQKQLLEYDYNPSDLVIGLDLLGRGNPFANARAHMDSKTAWRRLSHYEGFASTQLLTARDRETPRERAARGAFFEAWEGIYQVPNASHDEKAWLRLLNAHTAYLKGLKARAGRAWSDRLPDLGAAQRNLDSTTALVGISAPVAGYSQGHDVWAYVVRRDGLHWINIAPHERRPVWWWVSLGEVWQEMTTVSTWPERVPLSAELEALLKDSWDTLWKPLAPALEGVKNIVFIGDGIPPMGLFPLDCLLDPQGQYLGDRFAFCFVPSIRAWQYLTSRPSEAPTSCFLIGDAHHTSAELATLPRASRELQAVAGNFREVAVLQGAGATRQQLNNRLNDLQNYGVLHISTHVQSDPADVSKSGVLLSETSLGRQDCVSALEILLTWNLDADLVNLSGCSTGISRAVSDIKGIHLAMLAAGANAVLASLWDVEDEATALLMQFFYESWIAEGETKAAALQHAKRRVRDYTDGQGRHPFRHPAYWAGFVLNGNGN